MDIWPWPLIFKVKFWKCRISGMGGPIDMERKGCESIGCYHIVTLNCDLTIDLDPWFSRSNFENAVSQEWEGRLTWNEGMWVDRMLDPHCDFELWPWPLTSKVKFWKCYISRMEGPIDMERKGCESIGYRNWYQDWGHCGVTNDTVGDTTMTEIKVSISILSWCLKANWIYADSGVYKRKIAHKTASNQPLWKAWPQPIVTAASLVTSWLPLWCHSDACVTKSWQYAPLKN